MRFARLALFISAIVTAPLFASSGRPDDFGQSSHSSHRSETSSAFVRQVRQVTQPFRQAIPEGYEQFLGCVSGPQEGAMGVHFVNFGLVADGELDVNKPEALIYEAENGRLRLVGVEYIVMADSWHANHVQPPVLEGQLLQYNGSPNRFGLGPFYELHVWAWRDNPNGAFVDWNTRVSCEGQ